MQTDSSKNDFLHLLGTVCPAFEYLVSGPTRVPDNDLTASSTFVYMNLDYGPKNGRLYNLFDGTTKNAGRWRPLNDDTNPFIQVESLFHVLKSDIKHMA